MPPSCGEPPAHAAWVAGIITPVELYPLSLPLDDVVTLVVADVD